MARRYEGLPAAANVQQAIIFAQLQILRDSERAARAGTARSFVAEPGTGSEVVASWSPAEE
jgi:hypothetical protein